MIIDSKTNQPVNIYFRKVQRKEIKEKKYNPQGGWDFNWLKPLTNSFEVYGMITEAYPDEVQGLIAVKPNYDDDFRCVDVEIIESAPHNKKMKQQIANIQRKYIGVGKCLVAFACQYSIDKELEGCVELTSKSSKLNFYINMGAVRTYSQNMAFSEVTGVLVAQTYLQGGIKWWKR
ncbi:hypothetical protein PP175_29665 (plasmid) [Aneurinibacillus sp. Ricciae_BoGa-3]|uniref:hypothetical protein n=1 Tax=Aneurinibacillus sp. Ricciae_BoGa-3 TaxID=3022697 RepID=UPI00233FB34B|nr:hypothetical protein [Aneurinibacillus sp. Ricciae_BoGa-3]WCK57361.1 hypothetical protein PP175_29665 [Aneurinibacillus sp. Ricciae_BoGa-3]